VVELNYIVNQGKPTDFGWVMPLPGKPEVSAAPADFFARLDTATKPKKNYLQQISEAIQKRDCMSVGRVFTSVTKGLGGSAGAPTGSVSVVSQQKIGLFEVSVVQATDPDALQNWAATNGYSANSLTDKAVEKYITDKWYFVMAKLPAAQTSSASMTRYNSQPILLNFETETPVYPWRLAAYNGRGEIASNRNLPVQLYTLQPDARLEPINYKAEYNSLPLIYTLNGLPFNYGEKLAAEQSAMLLKDLPGNNAKNYFVAKYGGTPGATINANMLALGDLQFQKSADDSEPNSGKMTPGETALGIVLTLIYPVIAIILNLWPLFVLVILTFWLIFGSNDKELNIVGWLTIFSGLAIVCTLWDMVNCNVLPALALTGTIPYIIALAISLFALIRRRPRKNSEGY
jgi:hypothetical protein